MADNTSKCPYCGHENTNLDWDGLGEDEDMEVECSECEKYFTCYFTICRYVHDGKKVPCLNDRECDMQNAYSYNKYGPHPPMDIIGRIHRCPHCGNKREVPLE